MSLKHKIFNIFAAIMIAFGSVPTAFLNTFAEESNPAGEAPYNLKTVTANGDGTYDIRIEIKGVSSEQNEATKANVVVVYDTSGSMNEIATYKENATGRYGLVSNQYVNLYRRTNSGRCSLIENDSTSGTVYTDDRCNNTYSGTTRYEADSTRMDVAQTAVNTLAEQLLSQNDPNNNTFKDVVEMAFVGFATNVHTTYAPTTDLNTFKGWVNNTTVSTGTDAGTNWEAALSAANDISFGSDDEDKTYIIFVSDGNPTFRASQYGANNNDCYSWSGYGPGATCSVWGNGQTDPDPYRNFNAAQDVAEDIIEDGKEFYAVGAFGNATNMANLGGTYYNASDKTALEAAFADIVDKITKGLSVADLEITDGITAATSVPIAEHATAGAFRYEVPHTEKNDWGEPGVDFAEAYFDGSSVHWNPGHDKTLSNNETAAVIFTVWPSQEALDCIAKIKNGETCDKNLEQFGLEVVEDGNKINYYLNTNTSASFTYRTATKIEGSSEVSYSDPAEVTIETVRNIPPLPESLLSVTKVWADSMDPKQRDDISKVTLDFYVDDVKVNTYEFTGNKEGSEWINANGTTDGYSYAIAPGVMKKLDGLSESEAATLRAISNEIFGGTVTVDGVEYAVLEKGHTYRFEEFYTLVRPDSTNHYKITKKIYHPMIVDDGSIHDVEFSEDKKAAVIDSETLTKISAENTLNGGIKVYKKVINNDVEDTSVNDDYTITINVSEETGLYRILHADGTRTDDIAFENGTITVTIKQTDQILVKDLLDGTTFSVSEVLPEGYDRNKVEYELIDYNNNQTSTTGSAAQVVHGNMSSTATVTNYLSSGDLIISKEVIVNSGNQTQAEGQEFSFTVKLYKNKTDEEPTRVDTETCKAVKHGETCTIENIPKGWYYEITEAAKAGFNDGEETVKTGTIKQGDNEEEFENTYEVSPLTTTVFATKGFTNDIFWLPSDNFTFQLKYNDLVKDDATVNLDGKTATFEVTISDEGEYQYTITELEEGFREGVSRVEDDADVVATIVTRDKGDGTLELVSKTYSKEDQTIYNQYKGTTTLGANKELEFEKVLENRDWENTDEFTFTITSTDEDAPMPEDTSLTVKKNTTGHKVDFGTISFTEANVNQVYHYTVTESFDTSKIQSVVQSDDTKDGISFTVEVIYTDEGELSLEVSDFENTFTNIYEITTITAKKVWEDDDDRDGKRSDYDNLFVAVKDGDTFVAYEAITGEDEQDFTFAGLQEKRDGETIEYAVVEAKDCSTNNGTITCTEFTGDETYSRSIENNVVTNTHTPETKKIKVKKTWTVPESGLPSTTPTFIMVDMTNDNDDTVKAVRLEGNGYGDWESDEIEVLVYKNHGEEITYEVKETGIGEDGLTGDNEDTLYVYANNVLEGKWVASAAGTLTVNNTWTPATSVYEGSSEFSIKKIKASGKIMPGVKFKVNGKEYTTDGEGMIKVIIPADEETAEDNLTFEIEETETLEGYDLVDGTETLTVTSVSEFVSADEESLVNTFKKTYTLTPTEIDGYDWNSNMYTVTNERSVAKSLKIEKTFIGVSKDALKDLTFTVTGPDDFGTDGEVIISFSEEDCTFSGNKATCEVKETIPTGKYTVKENNAEVEYFTLTTTGDNEETKTVGKNDEVVFKIKNEYVVDTVVYEVVKIWDDAHDKDGIRPDELEIKLLANGDEIETVALSMSDSVIIDEEEAEETGIGTGDVWIYVWEELPIADENAELIKYTAEEILESDDYELVDEESDDYYAIFVNYHEPKPEDPCALGGCGADTPNTGVFTAIESGATEEGGVVSMMIGMAATIIMSTMIFVGNRRKAHRLTK